MAVALTSMAYRWPWRSTMRSTSSPPVERQWNSDGSSPDCRKALTHSVTTAVSTSAPAVGPPRSASRLCRPMRKPASAGSIRYTFGLLVIRLPRLLWKGRSR